jgi:hypothetical protein
MMTVAQFLFKKIELWAVLLIVWIGIVLALVYGWAVYRGEAGLGQLGRIAVHVASLPDRALLALTAKDPYLVDEDRFPGQAGFSFSYAPGTRSENPFLLINRHDPDRELGVSELWDLDTQKLIATQTWPVDAAWASVASVSKLENYRVAKSNARFSPYHTLLLPDGRMISQYSSPLVQANACGKISIFNGKYLFHHSIEQGADGNLWIPAALEPKTVDLGDDGFVDDGLTELTPSGSLIYTASISRILMDNALGYLLTGGNDFIVNDDPIHLNDIQPVLQDGPYYKKGDLFVSMRNLSLLMLFRPTTNKILWYSMGQTSHQHDVDILSYHEISLIDNKTIMRNGTRVVDGTNRYLVYDFRTGQFTEQFDAGMRAEDVRTPTNGRSDLLPGGALFVEESDMGRILALTPDGKVDWSYVNRDKRGDLIKLTWSRVVPRDLAEKFLSARKDAVCG